SKLDVNLKSINSISIVPSKENNTRVISFDTNNWNFISIELIGTQFSRLGAALKNYYHLYLGEKRDEKTYENSFSLDPALHIVEEISSAGSRKITEEKEVLSESEKKARAFQAVLTNLAGAGSHYINLPNADLNFEQIDQLIEAISVSKSILCGV